MGNLKAQELRIGNLVEYRIEDEFDSRKQWWAVTAIDSEDINWLEKEAPESTDYRPIPLTIEWIKNFGLEKNNCYPYKFLNGFLKIRNGIYFYKYYDLDIELKYVYQLQNLYFALSGTELTFKNKENE